MSRRNSRDPHDPGPMPIHVTTCKHCDDRFGSVAAPIIGQPPSAKYMVFMQGLMKHLADKHPQVANDMLHGQGLFGTMLCLDQFNTDDDGLVEQRDQTRHWVHNRTRRVRISDATIEEKVLLLALDAEKQSAVIQLIKTMRDVLEEVGMYPQNSGNGQPKIILPS